MYIYVYANENKHVNLNNIHLYLLYNKIYLFVAVVTEEPEFTEVIENITVAAGRNVKFACSVKNLGSYKVRQ